MKNKLLIALSFAKRDFTQKYVGTSLGQFWFVLSPIIMIAIYSIVFSNVMVLKLDITESAFTYSIYLISGIFAWTAFNTLLTNLINSFATYSNLLKKINVPMYVFQLSAALSHTFIFAITIVLATVFLFFIDFPISFAMLWLVPLMGLQIVFTFGLGVLVSLFVPFFRDIKVVVPIVMQLWFWTTPIIYFKDIVPEKFQMIFTYNPFFYFIDSYHTVFLYQSAPRFDYLFWMVVGSVCLLGVSAYLYKKMVPTIKDML